MRNLIVALVSLLLTIVVVGNAFYQKKQFYPSIVYLTKSNPSMAVIYVQSFTLVVFAGKLMRAVFFGELRTAEFEHLIERSWYAVTETCLAFTVFRDDFSPKFVALFTLLLFLKSFHWLAEDRVDFMERSPVISLLFHLRILSLLSLLGFLDLTFVSHAYQATLDNGASVQLVFGHEYAILLTIVVNIALKYILHSIDLHSETPWENKAVFLLYTEVIMGLIKVMLYFSFVFIIIRVYTLPLFAFRPMYYTLRAFKKAFNDVILSRRAIRNMNTLYPDATPEELAAVDNVCIICREDMRSVSKKLPCNHIFHTACLRSWFQRQQTCPTCRLNILRNPTNNGGGREQQQNQPAQAEQEEAPAPPHPAPPHNPQPPPNNPDNINLNFPWIHQFNLPPQQPTQQGSSESTSSSNWNIPFGVQPEFFPEFSPLFPFLTLNAPPPLPPTDGLSLDELKTMEKMTREGVEARLKCLQNISRMLDTSVIMMQQYCSAAKAASESCPMTFTKSHEPEMMPCSSKEAFGFDSKGLRSDSVNEDSETVVTRNDKTTTKDTCDGHYDTSLDQFPDAAPSDFLGSGSTSGKESSSSPSTREKDLSFVTEETRKRRLEKFFQENNL